MDDVNWDMIRGALRRRGVDPADIDDMAQDAAYHVCRALRRNPSAPVKLTVWRAVSDALRGRTPCRDNPNGYVDAVHPADAGKRRKVDAEQQIERRKAELLAVL